MMKNIIPYIAILIAIVGTTFGVLKYIEDNVNELEFNYSSRSLEDFISLKDYNDRLKFNIDGVNYENLCITSVSVKNIGKDDIIIDDFKGNPLIFSDTNNTKLIKIDNLKSSEGFLPQIKNTDDKLFIEPILIKVDEWVTFDIISEKDKVGLKYLSRIDHLKKIEIVGRKIKSTKSEYPLFRMVVESFGLGIFGYLFLLMFTGIISDSRFGGTPNFVNFLKYRPNNFHYRIIGIWIIIEFILLLVIGIIDRNTYDASFYMYYISFGSTLFVFLNFRKYGSLRPYKEKSNEEIESAWSSKES